MGRKTIWTHTLCNGEIDTKTRTCLKCGYIWSRSHFFLDPYGIRPIIVHTETEPTTYWTFIDKIPIMGPYATEVAKRLPNWPRWLRVVSVVVTYTIIGLILFFLIKGCIN
jgi:hypothetical protein